MACWSIPPVKSGSVPLGAGAGPDLGRPVALPVAGRLPAGSRRGLRLYGAGAVNGQELPLRARTGGSGKPMFSELEAYRQGFSRCLLLDLLESVIVKKPAQQAKVVKAAAGISSVFDRAVLPRRGIVGCEGERLTQG